MARTTKGRIFTRGKKNYYYLQYYVNGKEIKVALRNSDGKNITNAREAEKTAKNILSPLMASEESVRLEKVAEAMATAEQKAERAEQESTNTRSTLANGWELFYSCPKRPKSCRRYTLAELPRNTTAGNYRGYYGLFLAWMEKHHPQVKLLADVTEEIAQAYIASLKADNASGTVNKYIQFFKCFYSTLLASGKILCKNPFVDIEREEHTYHSKKPLSVEQIADLLDNATGEIKILIALGYFTGLRRGDCCTLLWSEVDLLRGVIERIPRKTANRVKEKSQATVKIGISPYLAGLLDDIMPEDRQGYVLPGFAQQYLSGKEYLVTNRITAHFTKCGLETRQAGTGAKFKYDGQRKVYAKAARAITLYGFHSLRYSYISHNAEAGTPAAIIQRNAGHRNPAMTEHYTRISDNAARMYAEKLQLPQATTEVTIESRDAEPERDMIKKLADTLSIEEIRRMLAVVQQ